MNTLIIFLIIFFFLILSFWFIIYRIRKISKHYFNTTDLKKIIELAKLEESENPKSVGSLDSLYLNNFKKDFPTFNLNELKRLNESFILDMYDAIEKKNIEKISNKNEKIISYIKSRINDSSDNLKFTNFKFHATVLNKYEKEDGIANLYLASSFEYLENGKKIQKRIKSEYIYIINEQQVKNIKAIGLNCPNCGAPITTLNHKKCSYCKTGVIDLIKKSFILNDISEY